MFTLSEKKCEICGEQFIPANPRQRYCKRLHKRTCPICGKLYDEPNLDKFKFPPTTCSMECRTIKRAQTSMVKYGMTAPGNNPEAREKAKTTMQKRYGVNYAQESSEIRQKSIQTCIDRYGVDNPQKCEEIKEKTSNTNLIRYGSTSYLNSIEGKEKIDEIMLDKYGTTVPLRNDAIKQQWKNTNLEIYGTENPGANPEVREKMKQTSVVRYGTEYPQSSEIVKQHIKDTFIRNYGVDNCFKSKEIIEKIHNTFFERYGVHGVMDVPEIAERIKNTNLKRYGVPYYVMLPNVAKSSGRISEINKQVKNRLTEIGMDSTTEFPIENYSYDLRITASQLLIEINPSYTHNSIGNHWNNHGIDKNYHLRKSITAEQHGYRCIHLWDWDNKSKFINSLSVKHIVYTNEVPVQISNDDATKFIQRYGLYDITKNIYNVAFIGIKYKTKLMHIMGFRQIDPILNIWELVCIENRFNYTVYNGHQKILDEFIHHYNPSKIISYADFSKTNGESLDTLGFEYTRFILPTKIWSKGRHAIIDDPSIVAEAMIEDKWLPVYNCGYKVYEKTIHTPKIPTDD